MAAAAFLAMRKGGMAAGLAAVLGWPCHGQPARSAPKPLRGGAVAAAAHAAMPIDGWYMLAPQNSAIAGPVTKQLDTTPAPDGADWITVYGRRHDRDAEWRAELRGAAPVYEAQNSAAAQRLYAPSPSWDSPEEQRMMSDAKDALGLCGALGGWVSCPNK